MVDKDDTDMIERMRSVPRIEPRASFRVKIAFSTMFPRLGMRLAGEHVPAPDAAGVVRPAWSGGARFAAAAATILLLAFIVMSSLVLASGGSKPGEPLYGLKRMREKVGLAFTWSTFDKASKHLDLASSRLEELDGIAAEGAVDPDLVENLARDYKEDTLAASVTMRCNPGAAMSQDIARRLEQMQTQKANIAKRLSAASAVGVLARSQGAGISVRDPGGQSGLVAGGATGSADEEGRFRFAVNVTDPSQLAGLDVVIEADGRKEVLPLYEPAASKKYSVALEPAVRSLELNTPTMVTLKVTRADGSAVRSVKLGDRTLTCLINGRSGDVVLPVGAGGKCSFSLTKTSADVASRIAVQADEGGWVDTGASLRLGGWTAPDAQAPDGAVTVKAVGNGENAQSVEIDNGLVKVTARRNAAGEVVSSLGRQTGAVTAGPFFDGLVAEARAGGRPCAMTGPVLTASNEEMSSYRVSFEMALSDGYVRKTYDVSLSEGKPYAVIRARVELSGGASAEYADNPAVAGPGVLRIPAGTVLEVGGAKVRTPGTAEQPSLLTFQIGSPFVAYQVNGDVVVAAYPIDSETYPRAWELTQNSVAASFSGTAACNDVQSMLMLGFAPRTELSGIASDAREGLGDPVAGSSLDADAGGQFSIVVQPTAQGLAEGKHHVTIQVFKKYEKIL